jgi:hypothetical protein
VITARATTCVSVDDPDEVAEVGRWFQRWRPAPTHCSENQACGCCVEIWDVQGPMEAIHEIHEAVRAWSDWSRSRA